MRFVICAALGLALGLPAGLVARQGGDAPACRGSLDGDRLTTTIEFPDGYKVEGPWRVNGNRAAAMRNGQPGIQMSLTLDGIVEVDPLTGERVTVRLPQPIETTFEGETEEDLVYRAARVWCTAILKAQEESGQTRSTPPPSIRG